MRYYVAGDVLPPSSVISMHADHIKPHFARVTEMGNVTAQQRNSRDILAHLHTTLVASLRAFCRRHRSYYYPNSLGTQSDGSRPLTDFLEVPSMADLINREPDFDPVVPLELLQWLLRLLCKYRESSARACPASG